MPAINQALFYQSFMSCTPNSKPSFVNERSILVIADDFPVGYLHITHLGRTGSSWGKMSRGQGSWGRNKGYWPTWEAGLGEQVWFKALVSPSELPSNRTGSCYQGKAFPFFTNTISQPFSATPLQHPTLICGEFHGYAVPSALLDTVTKSQ